MNGPAVAYGVILFSSSFPYPLHGSFFDFFVFLANVRRVQLGIYFTQPVLTFVENELFPTGLPRDRRIENNRVALTLLGTAFERVSRALVW